VITICTAIIDASEGFLEVYEESIVSKLCHVTEVLLCKNDADAEYNLEWTNNGVNFKKFGCKLPDPPPGMIFGPGSQHALSIHECIDRATTPYVFWCDADIFFYTTVDELYLELMREYELDIIGVSHTSATTLAQSFFPWHGNLLVKKDSLPKPEDRFLESKLPIKDKYLLMNAVEGTEHEFPNPNGNFDTCSYLCYWAIQKKWKWLAFQTTDSHIYTTSYCRGNVKVEKKMSASHQKT